MTVLDLDRAPSCTPLTPHHYLSFRNPGDIFLVNRTSRVEMWMGSDALIAITRARREGASVLATTCDNLLTLNGRPYGGEPQVYA